MLQWKLRHWILCNEQIKYFNEDRIWIGEIANGDECSVMDELSIENGYLVQTNGHLMLTTNSLYYVASPQNQGKYKTKY